MPERAKMTALAWNAVCPRISVGVVVIVSLKNGATREFVKPTAVPWNVAFHHMGLPVETVRMVTGAILESAKMIAWALNAICPRILVRVVVVVSPKNGATREFAKLTVVRLSVDFLHTGLPVEAVRMAIGAILESAKMIAWALNAICPRILVRVVVIVSLKNGATRESVKPTVVCWSVALLRMDCYAEAVRMVTGAMPERAKMTALAWNAVCPRILA